MAFKEFEERTMKDVYPITIETIAGDGETQHKHDYHTATVTHDWREAVKRTIDEVHVNGETSRVLITVELDGEDTYIELLSAQTKKKK